VALAAADHRMAMSVIDLRQQAESLKSLPLLRSLSTDGLILDIHSILGDIDAVVSHLRVPYVFVNAPGHRPCNTVMPDDLLVARQATQYLIDRGHRSISYFPCCELQQHSSQPMRMQGYAQAMMAAGLPSGPMWDIPSTSDGCRLEDYIERVNLYRKEKVTGVVSYNAPTSAYLLRACIRLGVRIPEDLSIISCDYDRILPYAVVPITGYQLDRIEMGEIAVNMLLRRIEHDGADEPSVVTPAKLVEMESVRSLNG